MKTRQHTTLIRLITFGLAILTACTPGLALPPGLPVTGPNEPSATFTPFRPEPFTLTPSATPEPTATATPIPSPTPLVSRLWLDEAVPDGLRDAIRLPLGWDWAGQADQADLRLEPGGDADAGAIHWVYALAVPFNTVLDEVSLDDVRRAWRGESHATFADQPLLVAPDTIRAFTVIWGSPSSNVMPVDADELTDKAWEYNTWALLPFERLEPRLKVLYVDGQSPLEKGDLPGYPLRLSYVFAQSASTPEKFRQAGGVVPATNRDPARMTVVMLTGTTALVRAIAGKMETNGMAYPARDILDWLLEPDFTHVSNEVSFNPDCPAADPLQTSLMFCSRPEYIQLLDAIDADLIELSGNHNNDWGKQYFTYSLDLYGERGWQWFAGGANLEEANQPALIEHNGNRLAFIGCNLPGPPNVWATETEPGARRCDMDEMEEQIRSLRDQNYTVVVTFQYNEIYYPFPGESQERDFRRMAEAGAAVVSGSQAHFPQGFAFQAGNFIHYGLGNLFFDQMDIPVKGTRREFLDRHIFYDGRLLSTEVLTAYLEDYARPRPMMPEERAEFLEEIFAVTDWEE